MGTTITVMETQVQGLRELVAKVGRPLSKKEVRKLLREIVKRHPQYPSEGDLQVQTWEQIGCALHAPPQSKGSILNAWSTVCFALRAQTETMKSLTPEEAHRSLAQVKPPPGFPALPSAPPAPAPPPYSVYPSRTSPQSCRQPVGSSSLRRPAPQPPLRPDPASWQEDRSSPCEDRKGSLEGNHGQTCRGKHSADTTDLPAVLPRRSGCLGATHYPPSNPFYQGCCGERAAVPAQSATLSQPPVSSSQSLPSPISSRPASQGCRGACSAVPTQREACSRPPGQARSSLNPFLQPSPPQASRSSLSPCLAQRLANPAELLPVVTQSPGSQPTSSGGWDTSQVDRHCAKFQRNPAGMKPHPHPSRTETAQGSSFPGSFPPPQLSISCPFSHYPQVLAGNPCLLFQYKIVSALMADLSVPRCPSESQCLVPSQILTACP